jgi:hypothetical protein
MNESQIYEGCTYAGSGMSATVTKTIEVQKNGAYMDSTGNAVPYTEKVSFVEYRPTLDQGLPPSMCSLSGFAAWAEEKI